MDPLTSVLITLEADRRCLADERRLASPGCLSSSPPARRRRAFAWRGCHASPAGLS